MWNVVNLIITDIVQINYHFFLKSKIVYWNIFYSSTYLLNVHFVRCTNHNYFCIINIHFFHLENILIFFLMNEKICFTYFYRDLNLRNSIFQKTSTYVHFGREIFLGKCLNFGWVIKGRLLTPCVIPFALPSVIQN